MLFSHRWVSSSPNLFSRNNLAFKYPHCLAHIRVLLSSVPIPFADIDFAKLIFAGLVMKPVSQKPLWWLSEHVPAKFLLVMLFRKV